MVAGNRSEKKIDLHTHSTFSDGVLPPEKLLEEAQWNGLSAIALTDHDNVDGLASASKAGKERSIEVIAGVELSCEYQGMEAHILGFMIEPDENMKNKLKIMQENRESRMERMVRKLQLLGIKISYEELPVEDGMSIGRPHLARVLVEKNICRTTSEAFEKYIGDTGVAYVPKDRWTIPEGIEMIKSVKGISVLAHPGPSGMLDNLELFVAWGIQGIEVFYPQHSPDVEKKLFNFCTQNNLVMTGGSDFHSNISGPNLGMPFVPYRILESLRKRKEELWPDFLVS